MDYIISKSTKGTKSYPLHSHTNYEISFCLGHTGVMTSGGEEYPFGPGCIVIVPPGTLHTSRSETELECIYVRSSFSLLFNITKPVVLRDNANGDGRMLASMLYNNRFSNIEFISSLCDAYIHFIVLNMKTVDNIGQAVSDIIDKITKTHFVPI